MCPATALLKRGCQRSRNTFISFEPSYYEISNMFNINKSQLWEQPQLSRASGNWRHLASCPINLQTHTLSYSKPGLSHHRNLLRAALVTSAQEACCCHTGSRFLAKWNTPPRKKLTGVGNFSAPMKTGLAAGKQMTKDNSKRRYPQLL